MRYLTAAILWAVGTFCFAASVGRTGPGGVEPEVDLPGALHTKNVGGSDGAGLCVFTSIGHAARWQNVEALVDFQTFMRKYPGGGWPEKVTQYIPKASAAKGAAAPQYVQVEGVDIEILRLALKSGRMPSVTYAYSPTGRYSGQRIAHMVNLVYLDDKVAAVLDNNFVGEDKVEWMSVAEFRRAYTGSGGGWSVVLLDPGPPAFPWN